MMKILKAILMLACMTLAMIALCAVTAQAGVVVVSYGYVTYDGAPVNGAVVSFVQDPGTTNSTVGGGYYQITSWATNFPGGTATVRASYLGHTNSVVFTPSDGGNYINISISSNPDNPITGKVDKTDLIPTFGDDSTNGLLTNIFPSDTDNFSLGAGIYYATKPFYYNGVGSWWIVIVLATVGGLIILSQGGSPFLLVMGLIVGNGVIWVFIPTPWQNTVIIMVALTISILILTLIRPGRDR